jgi:hypothetical protein
MEKSDSEFYRELFEYIDDGMAVHYDGRFREFGIPVVDGGNSVINIKFCPITGRELPGSLRDRWFDIAEDRGWLEDENDQSSIPEDYKTDRWWRLGLG